jgi:hypothetical protein
LFHALSYYCRWLSLSASRVDINTRQKYQELPWSVFPESTTEIESDPYFPGKQQVDEMTWQVTPRIIPLLVAIIPAEDEI